VSGGKSFVAQLRAKPEKREELIALQGELKGLVFAQEPDARVYEFFQSDLDPDVFLVIATFKDDAAFDAHMVIDFHDRLVPPILECLAEDMILNFYRSLG
jgi:quinol monooxygenase YgiN